MNRMPADRLENLTLLSGKSSGAHREVEFMDGPSSEMGTQACMGRIVFRDGKATARFFVQPMHDAGTKFAADPTQIFDMVQQGVDQCS